MRFLLRERHATPGATLAGVTPAADVRGRTPMRHRLSPWLATPSGMHVRRMLILRWKHVEPGIVGCLALLAMTSPSDAKSFLQALFGPPKIQTRSTEYQLPAFLRAIFTPHQVQRQLSRRGRLRPTLAVRRAPNPRPARSATARFSTPASLGPHPARVTAERLLKPASLGPDLISPDEGIAAPFMRDFTLKNWTS